MTSQPVAATLTEAQFSGIAAMAGDLSPLSPLHAVGDLQPAEPPGGIAWEQIVSTLATPSCSGAVTYMAPEGALQTATYGVGGEAVMVRNTAEGLAISAPPLIGETVWVIRQMLGDAYLGIGHYDLDLPVDEARALFVVVDSARRDMFRVLAGERPPTRPGAPVEEVMAGSSGDPAVWLAPYLDDVLELTPLTETELRKTVDALQRRGVIDFENGRVALGDDAAQLMGSLLMVEGHIRMRAAVADGNNGTDVLELRAIRGNRGSYAVWSRSDDAFTVNATSGPALAQLAGRFLGAPELVVATSMAEVMSGASEVTSFCASCGTEFLPEGQYCTKCGAKRP